MTILVDSEVNCVGFSGDGSCIVSGSDDGSVRVWDALSGVELKVLNGHSGKVLAMHSLVMAPILSLDHMMNLCECGMP